MFPECCIIGLFILRCKHCHAHGRKDSDCRCSTDAELLYRIPHGLLRTDIYPLYLIRNQGLVNDINRLPVIRQLYRDDPVEKLFYAVHNVFSAFSFAFITASNPYPLSPIPYILYPIHSTPYLLPLLQPL